MSLLDLFYQRRPPGIKVRPSVIHSKDPETLKKMRHAIDQRMSKLRNPERVVENQRQYLKRNADRLIPNLQTRRTWRAKWLLVNRDKNAAACKKWREKQKEGSGIRLQGGRRESQSSQ